MRKPGIRFAINCLPRTAPVNVKKTVPEQQVVVVNNDKQSHAGTRQKNYTERRHSSRINVKLNVVVQRDGKNLGAYTASNVSAGGLHLQGDFGAVFPGEVLKIHFIDFKNKDDTLRDMRALVLSRNAGEAHLTWLDCDSLFWVKLLKLLARATNDDAPLAGSDLLLSFANKAR